MRRGARVGTHQLHQQQTQPHTEESGGKKFIIYRKDTITKITSFFPPPSLAE